MSQGVPASIFAARMAPSSYVMRMDADQLFGRENIQDELFVRIGGIIGDFGFFLARCAREQQDGGSQRCEKSFIFHRVKPPG